MSPKPILTALLLTFVIVSAAYFVYTETAKKNSAAQLTEEAKRYYECTLDDLEAMWADTDVFYHVYTDYFESDFTLDKIYERTKLEVYEASQFHVRDDYEGIEAWIVDNEAAVVNGPILATYNLQYE